MINTLAVANGTTFTNGTDPIGLHSVGHNWNETLTVIRECTGYGVRRFVVADSRGRRGYAY